MKVSANGLDHHALAWGSSGPTVILVHGYMDAAGTWDRVAPALADAGFRVVALDMRGFGEAPRVPRGGYYHFADYVFDLADVVDALSPDAPVMLVGHSMGGTINTLYTGTYPERVSKLVSMEGLGPPDNPYEMGPPRMRAWIDGVRKMRDREPGTLSRDEARKRLAGNHPNVPADVLDSRFPHLVKDMGDGRVAWRFDPLHRTTSPMPFFTALFREFAKKVACPVLYVSGGPTGWHPPDEEDRLGAYPHLARAEIADAGHMMHWTRPDEIARLLIAHLG
jgi:pimeloyl-ACP methyl ester carboxylesterase